MASEADFAPGYDPTTDDEISASELLQMVRNAFPETNRGLLIYSATAPDVVANPRLKRFLWVDTTGKLGDHNPPFIVRMYNVDSGGWDPITLSLAEIEGGDIADYTINPLQKLSAVGLGDGLILVTASEVWTLVALVDAIGAGAIDLSKLNPGTAAGLWLYTDGITAQWKNIGYSTLGIVDGQIPVNHIGKGVADHILGVDTAASNVTKWMSIVDYITSSHINSILAKSGGHLLNWLGIALPTTGNQIPISNSGNTAWTFVNSSQIPGTFTRQIVTRNLNTHRVADAHVTTLAHTLGQIPDMVQGFLRYDGGYTQPDGMPVGTYIPIENLVDTSDYSPQVLITLESTQIKVTMAETGDDYNIPTYNTANSVTTLNIADSAYYTLVFFLYKMN